MNDMPRKIAVGGMLAALGVVLMVLGSFLGLGMYLSPMLAGLCLLPAGRRWGRRWQLLLWAAVSLLCLMLVPDIEENLMFIGLLGWYPALRIRLQALPGVPRLLVKLVLFNGIILALEALITTYLVPEVFSPVLALSLLILGNVTFLLYDFAIPIFEAVLERYLQRILPR